MSVISVKVFGLHVSHIVGVSVCVSFPGPSQTSPNSGPGHGPQHPPRAVLLHRLHPQAASQQALHPPHHHLRSVTLTTEHFNIYSRHNLGFADSNGCWNQVIGTNSDLFHSFALCFSKQFQKSLKVFLLLHTRFYLIQSDINAHVNVRVFWTHGEICLFKVHNLIMFTEYIMSFLKLLSWLWVLISKDE